MTVCSAIEDICVLKFVSYWLRGLWIRRYATTISRLNGAQAWPLENDLCLPDFFRKTLEELPTATEIMSMLDREFEQLAAKQRETTVSSGTPRLQLDCEHINDLKAQMTEFSEVFESIERCLFDPLCG